MFRSGRWLFVLISALAAPTLLYAVEPLEQAADWEEQAAAQLMGFKDLDHRKQKVPVNTKYLQAAKTAAGKNYRERQLRHNPNAVITEQDVADHTMVCVRKNNYWCIKNRSQWPGSIGQDKEGHAVFSKPEFAARAKVNVLRRYYTRCHFKTLAQIICAYAPANDCVGGVRDARGECVERQECLDYAAFLGRKMGIAADVDAKLFSDVKEDGSGIPTARARALMRNSPIYETSFFEPKDGLIEKGITLERAQWKTLLDKQELSLPQVCPR